MIIAIAVLATNLITYLAAFNLAKGRVKNYLISRISSVREDLFTKEKVIEILTTEL